MSRWLRRLAAVLMLSPRELAVLVVVFAASLPAVTARLYSSDEVEYFSYLRSLWFDHDVSFENEYQYFYDHQVAQSGDFHHTFLELQTATGRRINYGTMGCAILWTPFYAVGDAAARTMRALGSDVAIDGYSRPYVSAVAYGSACYGFATIVLSIAAARRVVGGRALSSGIAVWAGTPLLFYMYVAPPFSHACSAFAVALFVTVWLHVRDRWPVGGVAALGLSCALMAMVREQDVFFAAGPAVDFAVTLSRARGVREVRRLLTTAVVGCAAFALGYLPQLLAYDALYGHPRPSPLVTRKMFWSAPHALQVLVDPQHGLFLWTPLAILGVAGLVLMVSARGVRAGRVSGLTATPAAPQSADVHVNVPSIDTAAPSTQTRQIGACMLLMFASQVYISGAVESWTVAGAFGQRRFVAITILLAVGVTALRDAVRGAIARAVLTTAIALSVWWNIALMAEFGTSMMDRQRLELRRNAYDAFVTLPRTAPRLIYRYFTQRGSFYKPAALPPAEPR